MSVIKSAKITIPKGDASRTRLVKFKVSNVEFGASAPPSRAYRLTTTAGSCGRSVATQIDTDTSTPGLQASASVPLGGSISASITVRMQLQDVTTPDRRNPYRCTFDVSAVALDTDPDVDDGANPEGNTATIDVEVVDGNDY
jgi:hypothetical protein